MSVYTSVAIIGAGPYGLSIAAHLAARGVDFRIYGGAMRTWVQAMPPGMLLKSDAFASNLYDPDGAFTLEAYCAEQGLAYHATGLPVPIETFTAYGQAFQRRFAPQLEDKTVTALTPGPQGFELGFEDGSTIRAGQVVVASGIREFGRMPMELQGLPEAIVTHSSRWGDPTPLAGRDVVVIGAGASAIDIAALLRDRCAAVTVATRAPSIRFHGPPRALTLADSLLRPMTGLGPGWKSWLAVHAPLVFHAMPEPFRLEVVRRHLGPAPGWFMREQVEGRIPCLTGSRIVEASVAAGRGQLTLAREDGSTEVLSADHIIAATGYRVDLSRLGFLGPDLRGRLRLTGSSPALSTHFESPVNGLYFVGASAADSFGPLLRFAYGAGFTARRLARRLVARRAP